MGDHVGSTTARLVSAFWLVGGNLNNGANAGVGCVNSNNALSNANWNIGGRSSGEKNLSLRSCSPPWDMGGSATVN